MEESNVSSLESQEDAAFPSLDRSVTEIMNPVKDNSFGVRNAIGEGGDHFPAFKEITSEDIDMLGAPQFVRTFTDFLQRSNSMESPKLSRKPSSGGSQTMAVEGIPFSLRKSNSFSNFHRHDPLGSGLSPITPLNTTGNLDTQMDCGNSQGDDVLFGLPEGNPKMVSQDSTKLLTKPDEMDTGLASPVGIPLLSTESDISSQLPPAPSIVANVADSPFRRGGKDAHIHQTSYSSPNCSSSSSSSAMASRKENKVIIRSSFTRSPTRSQRNKQRVGGNTNMPHSSARGRHSPPQHTHLVPFPISPTCSSGSDTPSMIQGVVVPKKNVHGLKIEDPRPSKKQRVPLVRMVDRHQGRDQDVNLTDVDLKDDRVPLNKVLETLYDQARHKNSKQNCHFCGQISPLDRRKTCQNPYCSLQGQKIKYICDKCLAYQKSYFKRMGVDWKNVLGDPNSPTWFCPACVLWSDGYLPYPGLCCCSFRRWDVSCQIHRESDTPDFSIKASSGSLKRNFHCKAYKQKITKKKSDKMRDLHLDIRRIRIVKDQPWTRYYKQDALEPVYRNINDRNSPVTSRKAHSDSPKTLPLYDESHETATEVESSDDASKTVSTCTSPDRDERKERRDEKSSASSHDVDNELPPENVKLERNDSMHVLWLAAYIKNHETLRSENDVDAQEEQ